MELRFYPYVPYYLTHTISCFKTVDRSHVFYLPNAFRFEDKFTVDSSSHVHRDEVAPRTRYYCHFLADFYAVGLDRRRIQ